MNFYRAAVTVLEKLEAKKGSIKGIIGSLPEKSRKRTAALVIETLKYKGALSSIIEASSLLKHERRHIPSSHLALLLVHDLLFARGGIQASDGPIKQAILRHKTRLQAELVKLKVKRGVKTNQELAAAEDSRASKIPRYVRVNTIQWTMEEALAYLTRKGFSTSSSPFEAQTLFAVDAHIPELLAFHPSVAFHDDEAYNDGKFILQDKASCFPAVVLLADDQQNKVVIDATAAPGNKTTHVGAIMRNKGKLLAFERDKVRFRTLQKMLSKAGCEAQSMNQDFLSIDPNALESRDVTHILLDPSCSGSGIVNRLDYLLAEEENDDTQEGRLEKLSIFQLSMIKHAMKFPSVQRIVYSTCSIHAAENEQVVVAALESDEAKTNKFTLAPRSEVLPTWERRGLPEEMRDYADLSESLIRCSPGEDETNGFFVACFIRISRHESSIAVKRKAEEAKLDELEEKGNIKEVLHRKKKRKRRDKN